MRIDKLLLTQFKNYEDQHLSFHPSINVLVGENGSGKTNLLDAIYFLSLTKSAFQNQDSNNIQHDKPFFLIEGIFNLKGKNELVTCTYQRGQRKTILLDKKPYDKFSEHIGKIPLVLIAPNDTDLIKEGSEERRKFFDGTLSQLDTKYLRSLLKYNKLLLQRNALLKFFAERQITDQALLDTYDQPLIELAIDIHRIRKTFIQQFNSCFQEEYAYITGGKELVTIQYESDVESPNFKELFLANQPIDFASLRTGKGIHKDDFVFLSNGVLVKKFGSQGQQKSFVIALRLAQYRFLKQEKEEKPILLLDDIFDKLDDKRIQKLLLLIKKNYFGQVFITDARPERTQNLFSSLEIEAQFIEVNKGTLRLID